MQQLAVELPSEREWELLQLVDLVPCHLWRLGPDGEPTFLNQRMVNELGFDLSDTGRAGETMLQVLIDSIIHEDDAAAFGTRLRECLATGDHFAMTHRLRQLDGSYRWIASRAEPLRDKRGTIVQWYGVCADVEAAPGGYGKSVDPIAAIAVSAHAGYRWLTADPPNIERAKLSVARIIGAAESVPGAAGPHAARSLQSTQEQTVPPRGGMG